MLIGLNYCEMTTHKWASISASDLDYTLVNELEENRYMMRSIAKPIERGSLD